MFLCVLFVTTLYSCEKELINSSAGPLLKNENNQTRTQGSETCEMKAIKYRDYIDCTKEGTGFKVKCDAHAADDANLESYLSGLIPSVNNTTSLKNFLSGLSYISNSIQLDI